MATLSKLPPWQICDTATRASMAALERLNLKRIRQSLSIEDIAWASGLSIMTTTRALHGHGCNLAEYCALSMALNQCPAEGLSQALERYVTAL